MSTRRKLCSYQGKYLGKFLRSQIQQEPVSNHLLKPSLEYWLNWNYCVARVQGGNTCSWFPSLKAEGWAIHQGFSLEFVLIIVSLPLSIIIKNILLATMNRNWFLPITFCSIILCFFVRVRGKPVKKNKYRIELVNWRVYHLKL